MADVSTAPVTFDALCQRHAALMEAQAEEQLDVAQARAFVADAATAGVQIESIADRDAVRSMINYWTATIARSSVEEATATGIATTPPADLVRPTLVPFDATQSPTLDDAANPFMGLAAFDSDDAGKYFGRARVVEDLLQLVYVSPLVVVSGASGTGKSSLVRAGLIAALRRTPQGGDWVVAPTVPGRDPVASLAQALAPSGPRATDWIEAFREQVDKDPTSAGPLMAGRLGVRDLLLVIDQAEELFSLCQPEDRDRAARAVAAIAELPRAHVVITIRDEYLETERAARVLPDLNLAGATEYRIPPLQAEDIRAAIIAPAAEAGLVFQDGVVDRIVADVGTDPAALPLLQYALLRMWKRRDGNRITMAVYEKVGGPSTALSNAAQDAYDGLGSAQAKENTRLIFEQLVRPSLAYEFVRDRVSRGELERLLPPDSVRTVLTPFVDAALIQITPGADRSEDRIEIVHEALIRNWKPLRRWSLDMRDRERAYLSLDAQAQRWQESGRAWGHLVFGRVLADGEAALSQYRTRARIDPVIDRRVEAFLKASRSQQRRAIWVAATIALLVAIAGVSALVGVYVVKEKAARVTSAEFEKVGKLSEISAIRGEQARASSVDEDAARQFIQMLVSRGTIRAADLPPAFYGMTPGAADFPPLRRTPDYADDFLGFGTAIEPRVKAAGLVPLNLDNMRVFFDPRAGVPRLIVSQYDRSQPSSPETSDALYRWPRLPGQPDEIALADAGIGLAHLVDRREVAWGPHSVSAARGANLIATMLPLVPVTSRNAAFGAWPMVQAWMRVIHNPDAARVLYFAGAVPGNGPVGTTIPDRVWKVAVSVDGKGSLVVDAAMLPDTGATPGDLPGRTTLDAIERAAGIDFAALRKAMSPRTASRAAPAAAAAAVPAGGGATYRIFVQVKSVPSDAQDGVMQALRLQGFTVPAAEAVDPCITTPEIRYFFRQDAEAAARASSVVAEAVREAGFGDGTVNIRRLDANRFPRAKSGTFELWLCGKVTSSTW